MVWTLPLKLLESFPSFIKRLAVPERCDIISKLGRLPWRKVLAKESLG